MTFGRSCQAGPAELTVTPAARRSSVRMRMRMRTNRKETTMDRYLICDSYYWWLAEHHSGQGSREYARLSKRSGYYTPGPLRNGPEDPESYNELCARAGCKHEERS